jgi:alpha-beta hydrolase superfamily lysophospholipase
MNEHGAITRLLLARNGTQLTHYRWPAPPSPIGEALLLHGYGEHLGRYRHVARALSRIGLSVSGCDLRGHGLSGGPRAYIERFSDYLEDLEVALGDVGSRSKGPIVIVAHSMGALVAMRYLLERPAAASALVLSSPFLRVRLAIPRAKEWAGRLFSILWPRLSLPNGIRGEDVSRDLDVARDYDRDPLNNKNANSRWYTETLDAQRVVFERAGEIALPLLCLYGGDDRLADPDRTAEVMARIGSVDKTTERLPGQFHEIFNEPEADRERTLQAVTNWIASRFSEGAKGQGDTAPA